MAKLLLVETAVPDTGLRIALVTVGHDVVRAPSASFALTMLERNRPDAIVSRASLGDMRGDELCAIVRSDPATREIPFILVAGFGASMAREAMAAGVDVLVSGDIRMGSVVARIQRFLAEGTDQAGPSGAPRDAAAVPKPADPRPAVAAGIGLTSLATDPGLGGSGRDVPAQDGRPAPASGPAPTSPKPQGAPPAGAQVVQGSLAVMELPDVLQALARARKTGRLHVGLDGGEGVLVFESGRAVHAEYAGRSGEPAVAAMITQSEIGGTFAFYPLARGEVDAEPRTIHATVERLLLEVAAQIDESRVATERAAAVPPVSVEKG